MSWQELDEVGLDEALEMLMIHEAYQQAEARAQKRARGDR